MSKPNFLITIALLCMSFFAESFSAIEDNQVYFKVDPYPAFSYLGSNNTGQACSAYFSERVIVPKEKMEEYFFGKIYIQFIVEKDGSLSHVKLLHGVNNRLDKLALDAVKSMPRWKPGERDGKVVRTWFGVAVKWSYSETNSF